jgi:hypothetical protein
VDTPWTVHVLPYIGTVENNFGNTVDAWATEPVPKAVYGWAPAGTNESSASRHTVVSDLELFAPSDFMIDSKDRVRILGKTYEVQGEVEDFDHGPFGYRPGVRVNLKRFS